MIRVLGLKRIAVLALLLGLNALLGASVYMYLVPEKDRQQRQLQSLRGQNSTLQGDISRMQIEFDQLEEQQETFDALKQKGFFSNQSRRQAEKIFEKIQKEAGVISAVASIDPGELEENPEAKKAEHKILKSPIQVRIEALEDIDIFRYIFLVENFFPGHMTIEKISLRRQSDVSGAVLRSIASGGNPELVSAEILMVWRTMIPESEVINEGRRPL